MKTLARPLVQCLIIAMLGLAAYSNSFQVPFLFDDLTSIAENPVITDLGRFLSGAGLAYNARRFLGYLSFALNYRLGGLDVAGYHVVNLAIHICNGCLVAWLARLTLASPGCAAEEPGAGAESGPQPIELVPLAAALLFVAHPIQTQAVTYIVQRLAALATLFYLLALCLYAGGRLRQRAASPGNRAGGPRLPAPLWFAAALVAGGCALASKEIAFTLPLALLLYELCFFGSRRKKETVGLALLVLLALAAGLILFSPLPLGELLSDVDARLRLQTDLPRWHYLVTQCAVVVTYLRLLVWPAGQTLDYDYPVYNSLLQARPLFSLVLLLGLLALGLGLYLREERGTAGGRPRPERRLIAFGIFWLFLTLSIESSVIPIEDLIFEHRMYLPSAGAFLAVAGAAALAARRAPRAVAGSACLVLLLLTGATWSRNLTWGDAVSFWSDGARKAPGKARVHLNLGVALQAQERHGPAAAAFATALALRPGYRQAYGNLGAAYNSLETHDEAIAVLQEGLRRFPGDPDLHNNLGIAFAAKGEPGAAIAFFEAALRLAPGVEKYRINLKTARQEAVPR